MIMVVDRLPEVALPSSLIPAPREGEANKKPHADICEPIPYRISPL